MSTQLDQRYFYQSKEIEQMAYVVMSIKHNKCVLGSDVDVTY